MKKLLPVLLILAMLFMTGCGHIEDTNGDNPALVTITREKLTAKSLSHTSSGVSTRTTRTHFTINTLYEEIDVDYLELSGGKTSGVLDIMATEVKAGQTLTIACETGVVKGNLAVILLAPDGALLHEFAIGDYEEYVVSSTLAGIYKVRIGAESFSGAIIAAREIIKN
jgi:hypothetical protein